MKKIAYFIAITILIVLISILLNGCCCISHNYGDAVKHAPTCTEDGYTSYTCLDCGKIITGDYVSRIGHSSYISEARIEPTCTNTGYTEETKCRTCGEILKEKKIIPTIEHSSYVSRAGVAPSCTAIGYTDELKCKFCEKLMQNRETIPTIDHPIKITKNKVPATCIEPGLTAEHRCSKCDILLQEQTTIEPYGHSDTNNNALCDRCGIPYGNVIYIDSIDDLKAINDNLSGVYQLTANIDLTGQSWIALGSDKTPFSGYLYGNNFSIKGLSFENSSNALFSYVSGTIDGVILENVKFSSKDYSANMGGFTVYNKGTIKNCTLKGTNTITQSISRTENTKWPNYKGSKATYKNVFGGMCAINEGTILNCKIIKSFSSSFSNKNYFKLKPAALFPPVGAGDIYESFCESTIYFGGICGENKGSILDCTVQEGDANSISVVADYDSYGSSYATTNAYIGSIVGVNSKSIRDCSAKASVVTENLGSSSTNGTSGGQYPKLNIYMDNTCKGIIGKNNGTTENILYY